MPKNNRNIVSVGLAATMALIPLATQASDDGENWDDWVNQRLQKNVGTSVQKTQPVKVQPQKRVPIREVQTPPKKKDPISQGEMDKVVAPPSRYVGRPFTLDRDAYVKYRRTRYLKHEVEAVVSAVSDKENWDKIANSFEVLKQAWTNGPDRYRAYDAFVTAVGGGTWNKLMAARLMIPVQVILANSHSRYDLSAPLTPEKMEKNFKTAIDYMQKISYECATQNFLRDIDYLNKNPADIPAWRKNAGAYDDVTRASVPYLESLGRQVDADEKQKKQRQLSSQKPSEPEEKGILKKIYDKIMEWANDRKIVKPQNGTVQSVNSKGKKQMKHMSGRGANK